MEPVIVEGVGTISISSNPLKSAIESAMIQAIVDCLAEGIRDPEVIKQRKLQAREDVKNGRY